jgi:hypothetical protein
MKHWRTISLSAMTVLGIMAFAVTGHAAGEHDHAAHATMGDMKTVYACPMDGYTSEKPGDCALCGMSLEKKEMTASDAKVALAHHHDTGHHH